ncbi:hypothetical protein INR49_001474 [Caranx melampygus]|nr:hypothetical protein INR49_001474 [Caranx melampygus]
MICVDFPGFHSESLLIGSAVGALGMLLLCIPPLLFCCFRKKTGSLSPGQALVDTSDVLVTNETNTSQVDIIRVNKAALEARGESKLNLLHANAEAKLGEGEVRDMAPKMTTTTTYAEICLPSRGCDDGDTKGETIADSFGTRERH